MTADQNFLNWHPARPMRSKSHASQSTSVPFWSPMRLVPQTPRQPVRLFWRPRRTLSSFSSVEIQMGGLKSIARSVGTWGSMAPSLVLAQLAWLLEPLIR